MKMPLVGGWANVQAMAAKAFRCGHCGEGVASERGWFFSDNTRGQAYAFLRVCPLCNRPTYFEAADQLPGVAFGEAVKHLPNGVDALYTESRTCCANNSFTASVLISRKVLMHIAVDNGAPVGKNFLEYVEYLAAKGFVPPNGKGWVDHIRKKGNEANHEIILMAQQDAHDLISFTEMLLKFIYEFPKRVPAPAAPTP